MREHLQKQSNSIRKLRIASRKIGLSYRYLLSLVLLSNIATSQAQDPNFHIYLCFGQSNMEGNGVIEAQDKTGVDSRFQVMGAVNCNSGGKSYTLGKWQTATPPVFRCGTGLGPADYFGRTMVANLPSNIKVGVVPVAIGGCDIALFDKVNYGAYVATAPSWMIGTINEYGGNPYARLVQVAKLAQKDGVIKGILLHQGETNNGQADWPNKIKAIYNNLIADLGLDPTKTPLLAGELVTTAQGGACGGHNTIIAKLPNVIPNSHVVSAASLAHKGDNLHFTPAAYRTLGQRYANMMLSLLPKTTLPTVSITSPANQAIFTAPASINISANASVTSGSISSVKFYNGSTLLSTDNSAPYSYSWTNVVGGSYTIRAVATDNLGNLAKDSIKVKVNVPQGPYNGQVHQIPGIIQVEEYDLGGNGVAYSDDSPGSEVPQAVNYRSDEDVDIETCTDAGGGYNLGFVTAGEWLEYTVNVGTGTGIYAIDIRAACNGVGRTVSLSLDGNTIANNIVIPNTGAWQTWTTVNLAHNIQLSPGQHVLRMTMGATSYVNINYLTFNTLLTDTEDASVSNDPTVYPNPFESTITLNKAGEYKYKVYDMSGRLLLTAQGEGESKLGENLETGLYWLEMESNTGSQVLKIQKK